MTTIWWIFAIGLLLNMTMSLGFLTTRAGGADSLLATLLMGTVGVALVLALGIVTGQKYAVEVAVVFALLAAVLGVAFVRYGWTSENGQNNNQQ